MGREELLIEGFRPSELPDALGPELEADVLNGRPLVACIGTAEILISLAIEGGLFRAELAHVDGGGEGVLPTLISVIMRLARKRAAQEIEWLVFATNCARPNPRLRPLLERRGFIVREVPDRGFCYFRRDRISGNPLAGGSASDGGSGYPSRPRDEKLHAPCPDLVGRTHSNGAMKTSLDHLPAKKQKQLHAATELICKEAAVEMVILFGSHARGDWVEDPAGGYFSDFDVLVIVKSPKLVEKHELWSKIEDRARRIVKPTELSLIVHDIRDVNEQLEKGFYFFSDIRKEGILLYDGGRFELTAAKERTLDERRAQAEQWFKQWFESAGQFYAQYEFALEKGWNSLAAFDMHQATERYYHCALLVMTAYKPKTHNLEDLGKRAGDLHPLLRNIFPRTTPEQDRLFKLLKHAYVDARYSSNYVIAKEELEELAMRVRDLQSRVERACRERIDAMTAP